VYGEEFNNLYEQYEKEGKYVKKIKARELWSVILETQIETGMPYMLFKDSANRKSNQKNLGTIKSSNLCSEIIQYTDEKEQSVCNLASICLPKFIINKKKFNFVKLMEVTKVIVRNLNKIINTNFYPTEQTRYSNMKNRPIGIGIQGLADVYNILKLPFSSTEANELNEKIFETIYFSSLEESCRLAQIHGHYSSFPGSPFSEGLLQFDLWGIKQDTLRMGFNWDKLKKDIITYGTYNSLLTTVMPTASTSQIMNNSECIEPYMSNVFVRTTLAGEFPIINKNLIDALLELDMWNEDMRKLLMIHNGSIQNITIIPKEIRDVYKTAFEIGLKNIIIQGIGRGPFIDQSQSMNLFLSKSSSSILHSSHFDSWEGGLKTGSYYIRTLPAVNPLPFGIDIEDLKRLTDKNFVVEFLKPQEIKSNKNKKNYQDFTCDMCSA